jgi:hypothetical protein
MPALGPYVPFESWPESTRSAIVAAYADKAAAAAERIRESMRAAPCTCASPGAPRDHGRCGRCFGRVEGGR